jgi:acyl carrier protein
MNREEVFQQAREVMARTFGVPPESIVETTRADDVEGWDSLSHLIVLTGIERRLNVKLPLTEAYAAQNVGALVDLVTTIVAHQGNRA